MHAHSVAVFIRFAEAVSACQTENGQVISGDWGEKVVVRPIIIGVAGGTGSGKTTVVREIVRHFSRDEVALIQHDSYYRDHRHLTIEERAALNYDHPDALETELLVRHLQYLLDGNPVQIPIYNFSTHLREAATEVVQPQKVIIVEGILILVDLALRDMMDIKVFVDTDADIRFIRRLQRDITERDRTVQSVIQQYLNTVKPMHEEFVEPSKRYAHIIIPEGGYNQVAVDMLMTKIRSIVSWQGEYA
jgi:uridine kinase